MDDAARMAFNMKVLRRHDPAIEDIIESASFVVLYSHDGHWTKTGIEGPMFLYRRSASPPYGFFVLNRNGVENFSANLAMSDDLELTTEFIIYRASKGEQVTGIWIFEPSQRESVGKQMLKLQSTPITDDAPPPVSIASAPVEIVSSSSQIGQSISLDALFGTTSTTTPFQQAPATASNGSISLLNSIFDSASPKAALPSTASINDEEGLRAMLGLPNRQAAPAMSQATPLQAPASSPGLEALFASSTITPSKPAAEKTTITPSKPAAEKKMITSVNGKDDSAAGIVNASLTSKAQNGVGLPPALSRRDFVREVLSLIHTDKGFVDDLYQRYLTSSS